ncbi:MAG: glycosyl transferase family 1 [Chloroflexi bacterium B3_Chlor]|nr:MAG: glycosyl transferase family 1 [Chloroflexi bacterium B3_Chlor]
MRVLMISKACVRGSYQKKLEELAKLDDIQLAVVVPEYWQEKGRKIKLEQSHTAGYQLLIEKMALNGHFHLHFYPNLRTHVRSLQPEIVHIDEEPYNLATFHAMRLAVAAGAKALFFTWQNLLRRYPFPFSCMERYNYRHAAHAIAGNREGVDVLRSKGYQGPVTVIPQFGVDPEIYCPSPHDLEGVSPHFRIGYIGRLVEEKGVDLLLRAVARLKGQWVLSVLGDGPFKPQLEKLTTELGVGNRVTFQLSLPSAEMPSYYKQLDVLVLPSRTRRHWKEQFGRVLIEAMACGVPVIGSDCGEIPHVIGEAGLIFPEDDEQALSALLSRLMDDTETRNSLAKRGRDRMIQEYTQEEIAMATHRVYVNIMGHVH